MRTVCVRIKKEKWGSHDAPCPGFLDLQGANMDTLVRIIMYYNVPNNVDSLLKKRHPDAGENQVRQGCRTRFSAQWTATGIAKCSNEDVSQNVSFVAHPFLLSTAKTNPVCGTSAAFWACKSQPTPPGWSFLRKFFNFGKLRCHFLRYTGLKPSVFPLHPQLFQVEG